MRYVLVAVMVLALQCPIWAQSVSSDPVPDPSTSQQNAHLDLSSTVASHMTPDTMTAPVSVNLGGLLTEIAPGSAVTPAQMIALHQIMQTGVQTLVLDSLGAAQSGTLNLGANLTSMFGGMTIPQGVTVLAHTSATGPINLTGNLVNSGSFYLYSTNPEMAIASVSAFNIFNNQGAVLSTVLPSTLQASLPSALTTLSLNLSAVNNIVNAGTIASSGNLNLYAGGSITNVGANAVMQAMQSLTLTSLSGNITNAGLMAANFGNLNVNASQIANMTVNNLGGVMQALNGSINFRDQAYAGAANISLVGGDYLSQILNVHGGQGSVDINVGNVTGVVNAWAECLHLSADAPLLQMGMISATGDPYVTVSGDLDLSSTTYSPYLVAIAGQNIFTSNASTSLTTGGGNLVLIAGATPTGSSSVSVDRSGSGGDIYLVSGGTFSSLASQDIISLDTSNAGGAGGNVTLIAFADNATVRTSGGSVYLPTSLQIRANGSGSNSNGNLNIVAEASSGTAIEIGNFNTSVTSFGSGGGGKVNLSVATPNSGVSGPTIDVANGNITGSFDTVFSQNGNINVGNIRTGGAFNDVTHTVGSVVMSTGGSVVAGEINTSGINGLGGAGAPPVFDIFGTFVGNPGGDGGAGGHGSNITISAGGPITTGDLLSFGGGGGGGGGSSHIVFFGPGTQRVGAPGGDGGVGGDGGEVVLATLSTSPVAITVAGDINTSGGGGGGGAGYDIFIVMAPGVGGAGGIAGDVSITAPSTFSVTGNIFASGGAEGGGGIQNFSGPGGGSFGGSGGGGGGSSAVLTVLPVVPGSGGGGYYHGSSGAGGSAGASGFQNSGFGGAGGNGGSYANGNTLDQGVFLTALSEGGLVDITATEILGAVAGVINAGSGTVALTPSSGVLDIYLAPTSTAVVPGAYNVNQTVLDQITANSFTFYTASTTNSIFVQDSFEALGSVRLETGATGSIRQIAGTIIAPEVVLIAGGGIHGNSSSDALNTETAELTAKSTNGTVNVSNTGDVVLSGDSRSGIGQSFIFTTTGNITFAGASSLRGTEIVLSSPGDIGTEDDPFLFQSGAVAGLVGISVQAGGEVYLVNELLNDTVDVLSIDAGSTTSLITKGQINILSSPSDGSGISSNGNDITLSGADILAENVIDAGSATVKILPADNRPIVVNGTVQPGSFNITGGASGFIDLITAGTIIIGSADKTGTTSLATPLDASGSGGSSFNLEFINNGAFNANGQALSIGDNSLTITTDESVTLATLNVGEQGVVDINSDKTVTVSVLNIGQQAEVEIISGLATQVGSVVLAGISGQTGGTLSINSLGLGTNSAFVIGSVSANGIGSITVTPGLGFDLLSIINNGSIVIQQQLKGASVSLTTNSATGGSITDPGGGIGSIPSILADSITLQALGAANNNIGVTITNSSVSPVDLVAVSVGGNVTIESFTDVNIVASSGAGNNKTFNLETGAGTDASIIINHDVIVGGATGVIDLTVDGEGTITRPNFAGTLFANTVNLTSGSGDLGTDSSHVDMNATNFTFNTTGSVYLQSVGAFILPVVNMTASQAFSFRTNPDINGIASLTLTSNGSNPTIRAGTVRLGVNSSSAPGFIIQQASSLTASVSAKTLFLEASGNPGNVTLTTTNNFDNTGLKLNYNGNGYTTSLTNIGNVDIIGAGGGSGSFTLTARPDANGNANISSSVFIHMPRTNLTLITLGALSTISTAQLATSSNNGGGKLKLVTLGGDITTGDLFTDNTNFSNSAQNAGDVEIISGTSLINGGDISVGNIKSSSYTFPLNFGFGSTSTLGRGGHVSISSVGLTSSGFVHTGTIATEGDRGGGNIIIISEFADVSTQTITSFNGARLFGLFAGLGVNAGNVNLTAGTNITVIGDIDSNANSQFLSSGNPNVSRTNGLGGNVQLVANGAGALTGSILVTGNIITLGDLGAGNVVLQSLGGNIQTENIYANNLHRTIVGLPVTPFVVGSVTIVTGTALVNGGSIVVDGINTSSLPLSSQHGNLAGDVTLLSTGNGPVSGSITINGDIDAIGRNVNGNVYITTKTGDVIHTAGTIMGNHLVLTNSGGNFGRNFLLGGRPITTQVTALQFDILGNLSVEQTGDLIVEESTGNWNHPFIDMNNFANNGSLVEIMASGSIFFNGPIGPAGVLRIESGGDILNMPTMSGRTAVAAVVVGFTAAGTVGLPNDPIRAATVLGNASNPNSVNFVDILIIPPPLGQSLNATDVASSLLFSNIVTEVDDLNLFDDGAHSQAQQIVANNNVNILQGGEQVVHDIQVASHNSVENNINSQNFIGSTPLSSQTNQPQAPQDDQALGQNFAYCNSSDFNSSTQGDMHSHGATIGQQSTGNLCILQQGNFLFQPQSDITVQVQEGSVDIPKGATALVMETGNDVAVFDICDSPKARVRVKSGNKIITLSPGKQVVLTRFLDADFDHVNPSKLIGYKNVKGQMVADSIRAYSADFSLPSVMMSVAPMKRMLTSDSPADRKLVQRMIKNAVVLSMLPSKSGPFKTSGSTHP